MIFSCKKRASDGPLFPAVVSCLPPAAYFLSTATKSMQKTPFETDGFKSSFAFKSFARYGPSRELTQQQPRSRSGEGACGSMVGSRDSHSQCSHCLRRSVPHGRASDFFNCPRSGSVSRNTPIPCFDGIQDATLAHKRGSLETLGFKRRSLGTFCCYWQKVTRRRQQKKRRIMDRRKLPSQI